MWRPWKYRCDCWTVHNFLRLQKERMAHVYIYSNIHPMKTLLSVQHMLPFVLPFLVSNMHAHTLVIILIGIVR